MNKCRSFFSAEEEDESEMLDLNKQDGDKKTRGRKDELKIKDGHQVRRT